VWPHDQWQAVGHGAAPVFALPQLRLPALRLREVMEVADDTETAVGQHDSFNAPVVGLKFFYDLALLHRARCGMGQAGLQRVPKARDGLLRERVWPRHSLPGGEARQVHAPWRRRRRRQQA
jgi:hypothetical protein